MKGRFDVHGKVGRPDEIVGPCVYLASDAAPFVTGEVHDVDGGMQ